MAGTVTIASVRAHGVRQLFVYRLGKREGDWPCHHQSKLPIDRFHADTAKETLAEERKVHPAKAIEGIPIGMLLAVASKTGERR
jgi:hypothetical protein